MEQSEREPGTWRVALWVLPALAGLGLIFAWMFWGRPIQWDEFEFARASAWIAAGKVPYRDFFEHHTPLQWLLFAPFAGGVKGWAGVRPYLALRFFQSLLVLLPMLWTVWSLAGEAEGGREARSRIFAFSLLLLGPAFELMIGEFRVDAFGNMLFLAGIWLCLRSEASRGAAFWTGALLCASGLANLRMGPMALMLVVLLAGLRPASRTWGWHPRWGWIALGGAVPLVLLVGYLAATRDLYAAWRSLIFLNVEGNKLLGDQFREFGLLFAQLADMGDYAAWLLMLLGALGAASALRAWRRPGPMLILTLLALADLAFIWSMGVQYAYHLQGFFLMVVPVAALGARISSSWLRGRLPASPRTLGIGLLWVFAGWSGWIFAHGSAHRQMRCQDWVLREAVHLTEPGETIWDGNGAVLQREPSSYPYWFLPFMVRFGQPVGLFPDYSAEEFLMHPPGLILANTRTHNWLGEHPRLQSMVVTHFLPLAQNLWIPALSGRVGGQGRDGFAWVVPRSGSYQLYCSPNLAEHPWFSLPIEFEFVGNPNTMDSRLIDAPSPVIQLRSFKDQGLDRLAWNLNGKPLELGEAPISLHQGDHLSVQCAPGPPLGLMIVPSGVSALFQTPWYGAPFDAVNTYMDWKVRTR